jgi:uncharacterized protein YfiM (DUF2279 family)
MKPILFILAVCLPAFAEAPVWQQRDKQLHCATGAALSLSSAYVAQRMGSKHPQIWGFGIAVGAGIAKELYDRRHAGHTCDMRDALATSAGGALVFTVKW